MGNLRDREEWAASVRRIEPGDSVIGGDGAPINLCLEGINNRAVWLKTEIAKAVASIGKNKTDAENMFARKTTAVTAGAGLTGGGTLGGNVQFALGTPGTCSGNTTNWAGSNTHTHQLAAASPTVAGVAKLINNLTTDDADSALSAAMGKKLNEEKLGNSGNQTLQNGYLEINRNGWEKIRFTNTDGSYWRLECAPVSHSENGARFNFVFFGSGSSEVGRVSFKTVTGNEVAAYQSWVLEQLNSAGDIVRTSGNQNINGAKTFSEILTAGRNNHWGFLRNPVESGGHWVFETNPKSNYADGSTLKVNIKYEQTSGQVRYIHFPELGNINRTVAYQDWVTTQINAATGGFDNKIEQAAPAGTVAYFAGRNAPAGWLKANGAAVSRTTYAALFAAIGTTYGAGDGRTTFNLPDLRGEFVRGFDDGRNVDRGRELGSAQNQSMADHYHGIGIMNTTDDILIVNKNWSGGDNEYPVMEMAGEYNKVLKGRISSTRLIDGGTLTDGGRAYASGNGSAFHSGRVHHIATAIQDSSGNSSETRPRNVALLACIKI